MTILNGASLDEGGLLAALGTAEFVRNPFPVYDELRMRPGWRAPSGYRVFSSHADLMAILRDPETFGQTTRESPSIHEMDPPEHTRLRRLVSRAFTPRAAAAQAERIGVIVDQILDDLVDQGQMEVVHDLALPMPARVMAELLGVPYGDAALWQSWMEPIKESRGVVHYFADDPAEKARKDGLAADVGRAATGYLRGVILERKRERANDIVSDLLEAREADESLTDEEVLYVLFTILAAGLHTTASQLSNLFRALLETPGALELLQDDESLIDNAVEEGLRFDGALQAEHRVVRVATVVHGVALHPGERILILNGAANRDPEVFEQPGRFEIHRANAKSHLTFGWGVHRCLGAALAKAEMVVALERVLRRMPSLHLTAAPVQHRFDRWRGLDELRVGWTVAK